MKFSKKLISVFLLFCFFASNVAFAVDCPCELKAEKEELEASLEAIKIDYELEPSSENLQRLTDVFAKIEEINQKLGEVS